MRKPIDEKKDKEKWKKKSERKRDKKDRTRKTEDSRNKKQNLISQSYFDSASEKIINTN